MHSTATGIDEVIHSEVLSNLAMLEEALNGTLLQDWNRLLEADVHASLFQSPGWCLPWYRCYQDTHDPYLLLTFQGKALVGLVPLAIVRDSGALVFASDSMADYRDVVALPGHREHVVRQLVSAYSSGGFARPFQIGWLDPDSPTRDIVRDVCEKGRVSFRSSEQPCWRWFPPAPDKPSAQKFLKWYRRHGDVSFEVVASDEQWSAFRQEYFQQHSLRQLQAGRPTTFDDQRRRAFYDSLFSSRELVTQVTAFRVNGDLIAGHFGYVWRRVLLLGPPSIRLEEEQRSPAVILLSWIIQNAEHLGLNGFDLTIGDSDFKKRLGNRCVTLTSIELYNRTADYRWRQTRAHLSAAAKKVTASSFGADFWKAHVKPFSERLTYKRLRFRELGVKGSLLTAASGMARQLLDKRTGLVYAMLPTEWRPVLPRLDEAEAAEVHHNRPEDLLLWGSGSLSTASAITECARNYSRSRSGGRDFHTIVLNGRLAGWGYSYFPHEPAHLTETPGAILEFPPKSVSLYDFHIIPAFRGRRLYQYLLSEILKQRFAEGARHAFIGVLASNAASRSAIERVGFRLVTINHYRRFLTRSTLTTEPAHDSPSDSATAEAE